MGGCFIVPYMIVMLTQRHGWVFYCTLYDSYAYTETWVGVLLYLYDSDAYTETWVGVLLYPI